MNIQINNITKTEASTHITNNKFALQTKFIYVDKQLLVAIKFHTVS